MAPQAPSTLRLRASVETFESWCESQEIDPFQASIPQSQTSFFFSFMRRSYRSSPSRDIKRPSRDPSNWPLALTGQDPFLHNLLKSFLRERPLALQPFPAWDLSVVLFSLVKDPFEPLSEISLKLLTFKTVFLTPLAAGCRQGETHAVNYSLPNLVQYCPKAGSWVHLKDPTAL